ncbi:30S ribosomal protein S16 [Pseudobacteriovorax antillogorgiicola]|uniref:Small ribosomal subunit protein bS16 n=1 Tax=Pseudobacteriovorax antillogorgiicola TaxID=1513793 RepID=A0A1Y6C315_9BACT|nr:30S ribosomal protein S16 [Pseudobacteriovorax antillogorgiicola]TCS50315.1 small subunit ribosomal protein S16 [Pseudobacteriovorax antillogorgiicola]SMF34132.1 SSU ribosomal protein S16P [Pseudobacteriovorax antillogorgiicola]
MALTLRLQRHGSTHRPFYHIVATDSRRPRDGRFIEKLGYYDPNHKPSIMEVKADRVQYWYSHGAVVTDAVKTILKRKEVKLDRKAGK